jgi:hypothetical protein
LFTFFSQLCALRGLAPQSFNGLRGPWFPPFPALSKVEVVAAQRAEHRQFLRRSWRWPDALGDDASRLRRINCIGPDRLEVDCGTKFLYLVLQRRQSLGHAGYPSVTRYLFGMLPCHRRQGSSAFNSVGRHNDKLAFADKSGDRRQAERLDIFEFDDRSEFDLW